MNVLYFDLMLWGGVSAFNPTVQELIAYGANFGPLTLNGEWVRAFMSMFIHIGVVHLLFNMWCIWHLGKFAERMLGNWMFLLLYVGSGLGGSVASLWWNPTIVSAGASGAVFGVAVFLVACFTSTAAIFRATSSRIHATAC